jgi:hypothetical protein
MDSNSRRRGMAMSSGKAWIACLGLLLGACTQQLPWNVAANAGALPMTDNHVGAVWITSNDGHGHVWNGTQWVDAGPSPPEVELNRRAREYIDQKLQKDEQASRALKTRCDEMFSNLRIGMRVRDGDPTMTQCGAKISSYTKTLHNNHEVWSWKDGSGRSVYVDNGVLTTINGTPSSTAK